MAGKNFHVETTERTYYKLYYAITTNRPLIYSRYGDGDLEVMVSERNDRQQAYNPRLAEELRELFLDQHPNNLVGLCMHDKEPEMRPDLLEGWDNPLYVDWVNDRVAGRVFENAVTPHFYSIFRPQEMRHFLFQLKKVPNKTFVGNTSRELVEAVLGPLTHYIPTEYVDAYDQIEQWWPEVDAATNERGVVIGAAGLSTRAMNRRLLAKQWQGQAIDLGSTIDFLTGNKNRTWIYMAGEAARRRVLKNV